MKENVGGIDKALRIVIGLAILIWGLAAGSWWGLVGIVPLATGLVNRCPAYMPFGISTCKVKTDSK